MTGKISTVVVRGMNSVVVDVWDGSVICMVVGSSASIELLCVVE